MYKIKKKCKVGPIGESIRVPPMCKKESRQRLGMKPPQFKSVSQFIYFLLLYLSGKKILHCDNSFLDKSSRFIFLGLFRPNLLQMVPFSFAYNLLIAVLGATLCKYTQSVPTICLPTRGVTFRKACYAHVSATFLVVVVESIYIFIFCF